MYHIREALINEEVHERVNYPSCVIAKIEGFVEIDLVFCKMQTAEKV